MVNHINPKRCNGEYKSKREIEDETKLLLNSYRRENILLTDKIYNYESKLIPSKDELILNLKERIKAIENKPIQKSSWFSWKSNEPIIG